MRFTARMTLLSIESTSQNVPSYNFCGKPIPPASHQARSKWYFQSSSIGLIILESDGHRLQRAARRGEYNASSSLYTHKLLCRHPIGACRARNRSSRRTNGQRVRVRCGRPALRERLLIRNWPGSCSGTLHLWHLAGLPRHRVAELKARACPRPVITDHFCLRSGHIF